MHTYVGSIEEATLTNDYYREVLYTGPNCQLVVMTLQGGEEIGTEVHKDADQFFRIEEGQARFIFNNKEVHLATNGDAVVVPAGTYHNVVNASDVLPLRLYTIYSPPQHPDGTIHSTKLDAAAAEASEDIRMAQKSR